MSDRDFDDILNECIERMLGGETLEQCLADYPKHEAELAPLLRVTAEVQKISLVEPRAEFKAEARNRVLSSITTANVKQEKPRRWRFPVLSWHPRWIATTMVALLFFVVSASGVVAASGNSLPGDTLYQVKMVTEDVRLRFAFSDMRKAELHAQFARERVNEIADMSKDSDVAEKRVEAVTVRLGNELEAIELLAKAKQGDPNQRENLAKLREIIVNNRTQINTVLEQAKQVAPERTKPIIESTQQNYDRNYEQVLQATASNDEITPAVDDTNNANDDSDLKSITSSPKPALQEPNQTTSAP